MLMAIEKLAISHPASVGVKFKIKSDNIKPVLTNKL